MGRRYRDTLPSWACYWRSPHQGKFWRRCLHKAERALARGYGRTRHVRHYAREVCWKTW